MRSSCRKWLLAVVSLISRWPRLVAVFGFVSGVSSYLLVDDRTALAQIIAILMLLSWIWLVLENWLRASIARRFGFDMPPDAMRFVTQMVHQESLFFSLPFFISATTWTHGQSAFTILLALCALISMIDPLYYRKLAPRRALFVAYHALALFAVLLIVLPLLLYLTTRQSLALALLMALLFSLPSLTQLLLKGNLQRLPFLALILIALGTCLWQLRSWIPPAALQLVSIVPTTEFNEETRTPGAARSSFSLEELNRDGLYVWTAVKSPRGLSEQIHHVWIHEGEVIDRITLDIQGGREEGYRAWTHKLNFVPEFAGRWQVRLVTDSGQLIGMTRFEVGL